MSNGLYTTESAIWDRGYRECLLDMYLYLTGSELILDIDPARAALIDVMVAQVNQKLARLVDTPT